MPRRGRQELRATAAAGFAPVLIASAESPAAPAEDGPTSGPEPAIEVEFAGKAQARVPLGPGRIGGSRREGAVAAMIPVARVCRRGWAVGHTDMRRGMNSLALQVQETLGLYPHAGDLYVFRGKHLSRFSGMTADVRTDGAGNRDVSEHAQAFPTAAGDQLFTGTNLALSDLQFSDPHANPRAQRPEA